MGRIKTTLIKRTAHKLLREYPEEFDITFEKNKPLVSQYAEIPSKKIRNVVAGYMARLVKRKREEEKGLPPARA